MIAPDSTLRSLPRDLPPRQVLFLDAMRLSAEMAGLAYDALYSIALQLTERGPGSGLGNLSVGALAHTYAFIDAANRLREIARSMPGLKHNQEYELFMRGTTDVEGLRDVVQHLNRELQNIATRRTAAMGTITWLGPSPAPNAPASAWVLQTGSFYPGQMTYGPEMDFSAGLKEGTIADLSLTTSAVRVNLSDVHGRIERLMRSLEGAVREHPAEKGRLGSDVLMSFEARPVDPPQADREKSANGDAA